MLGMVLGLGAIIVGCVGLSFGFKDFGSPDNNVRWRAMGTLLAAVVLFILAWGFMIFGHFKTKKRTKTVAQVTKATTGLDLESLIV